MTLNPDQFSLRAVFWTIAVIGILLGVGIPCMRWGNTIVQESECAHYRMEVLEHPTMDPRPYNELLGSEMDEVLRDRQQQTPFLDSIQRRGGEVRYAEAGEIKEILMPENATDAEIRQATRLFPWARL